MTKETQIRRKISDFHMIYMKNLISSQMLNQRSNCSSFWGTNEMIAVKFHKYSANILRNNMASDYFPQVLIELLIPKLLFAFIVCV